jgi:hypothetical protein
MKNSEGIFALTNVMVARHFVPPFTAYDIINSKMATATSRCHFWVGHAPLAIANKLITLRYGASYITCGLFSVFVAKMEMQCTPQALWLDFKN